MSTDTTTRQLVLVDRRRGIAGLAHVRNDAVVRGMPAAERISVVAAATRGLAGERR